MTYLFLHLNMHLLLFLSPNWLIFCHMIISLIYIHLGPMLEMLGYILSEYKMVGVLPIRIKIDKLRINFTDLFIFRFVSLPAVHQPWSLLLALLFNHGVSSKIYMKAVVNLEHTLTDIASLFRTYINIYYKLV